ncbi:hypothetical protein RMSM_01166, partial [Rhodopirellula maiorica SM1]
MPPGATPQSPSSLAASGTPSAATEQLIAQTRDAMSRKDYRNAVELFRHSVASVARSPQMAAQVEKLRGELLAVGFDRELLSMPPTTPLPSAAQGTSLAGDPPSMQRLPSVTDAQPIAGTSNLA